MRCLSPEPACYPLNVDPERPVPELELHLACVLGVDLAVGKDGNGGAIVADGPTKHHLEARAVAGHALYHQVHFATSTQGLPRRHRRTRSGT